MLDAVRKDSGSSVQSIIGAGTVIKGEIVSKNSIKIEGEVGGKIESKETVIVFETGKVDAEIIAKQVVVSGEVNGNIFATERLEITAKGRVKGNITAPRVSIAEGVYFEGQCTMQLPSTQTNPPGQVKQATQQTSASSTTATVHTNQPSSASPSQPRIDK
ncbi:MAG: polymer-forming cytoskeletal protein [Candidatus Hydrogenedentes bacterium]|nr:polymer-forming cytoskeletal protein [Candidatus Hydrogenedentota bacterium]